MDSDISLALRLQANDRGIYDEEIIKMLLDEHQKTQLDDLDEILEKDFYLNDSDFDENNISYSHNFHGFNNMFRIINNYVNTDSYEEINTNLQNQLLQTYNNQHVNQQNNLQPEQNPITQFINMFMGMGTEPISTQTYTFNFNGNNYSFSSATSNSNNLSDNISNNPLLSQFFGSGNINSASYNTNLTSPFFTNILQGLGNLGQLNFEDPVPVALTQNALENLKDQTYEEVLNNLKGKNKEISDEETCSICFSRLVEDKDNYKYCILPCNHVFHSTCIKPYLKDYDYHCPICRESCGEHEAKIEI